MIQVNDPRELPGFKKKSFSMFFGGGEIWFEHLDGIYEYEELVLEKLSDDYNSFIRPSMPSLICFNLDETLITEKIIVMISDKLINTSKHFTRVCFVGADRRSVRHIRRCLCTGGFALSFINDFEKAKEWLVSENI